MKLQPTNKFVSLKVNRNKNSDGASTFYLPEGAHVDDPVISAEVISAPSDGKLKLEPGMEVLLFSHLIESVTHKEETYELVPESAILGFFV